MMGRVSLLTPRDLPDEHRGFVESLDGQGAFINLYPAMAHSPAALRRLYDLLVTLYRGALTPRIREIAILSAVAASNGQYALGWHLLDAQEAGLSRDETRAIIAEDDASLLSPMDATVSRFARELTLAATVSNATFTSLADAMDEREIVEVVLVVGLYRLVACVANGLSVELDEGAASALREFGLDSDQGHAGP